MLNFRLPCTIVLLALTLAAHASDRSHTPAARCGVVEGQKPQRVFADPGPGRWREFRKVEDVPEINLEGGQGALLFAGTDGSVLVTINEPGEDVVLDTDYCFTRDGNLVAVRLEFKTDLGWGYRTEGTVANGAFVPQLAEFFSMKTGLKRNSTPAEAKLLKRYFEPELYLKQSQLPFAALLRR